ncbi:MAG: cytochrome c [Holophaga sp.]|nr:cytochrome c [Holophaga sp.]
MIERYVSPAELKRLISALLVVIIFIALLAVFAFLVLPGVRNANAPATDMVLSPAGGGTGWLDPTDYPPEAGRTVPPIDPATVMTPNPEILARGQVLYAQNCVSCHGPKGDGDGPAGKGLKPSPRRFTQPGDWVNSSRIDGIYKTLEQGIKGSSMVAYTMLAKRDRMALVHYVRSLGPFEHGPEDPKALRALTDLFAHSGEVIPNRIPVARAMVKLETETRAPAGIPVVQDPALGAAILDPVRAAQTLAELPGWSGSDAALAKGIAAGAPGNGFAPAVALYSGAQWRSLRDALNRAVTKEGR